MLFYAFTVASSPVASCLRCYRFPYTTCLAVAHFATLRLMPFIDHDVRTFGTPDLPTAPSTICPIVTPPHCLPLTHPTPHTTHTTGLVLLHCSLGTVHGIVGPALPPHLPHTHHEPRTTTPHYLGTALDLLDTTHHTLPYGLRCTHPHARAHRTHTRYTRFYTLCPPLSACTVRPYGLRTLHAYTRTAHATPPVGLFRTPHTVTVEFPTCTALSAVGTGYTTHGFLPWLLYVRLFYVLHVAAAHTTAHCRPLRDAACLYLHPHLYCLPSAFSRFNAGFHTFSAYAIPAVTHTFCTAHTTTLRHFTRTACTRCVSRSMWTRAAHIRDLGLTH